jgi:thiol:disulfide interchange protein DsbA
LSPNAGADILWAGVLRFASFRLFRTVARRTPVMSSRLFAWLLLLILPLSACAQAPAGSPQAGVDYEVLPQGQRWAPVRPGRIEVAEVFAYWCHHCADFQPRVDAWNKTRPADVDFVYVPAAFDPEDAFARAYFAADMAKVLPKVHQGLYDAIHETGSLPRSNATVDEVGAWFGRQGLNAARLTASMRSPAVDERMRKAREFMIANRVSGTPTLVVNGKYVVRARRQEDRMGVVDALIAMERAAMQRAGTGAAPTRPR